MAISNTTSTTLYDSYGNGYTLTTYFIENSTNVSNNTSSITVRATLTSTGSYFSSGNNQTLTVQWWDSNVNAWATKATKTVTSISLGGTITAEATFNATHLSDGTLRGQSKAIWTNNNGGPYCPASGEIKNPTGTNLTTIPRTSVPTVSASSVEIGNNITISTNRASTSFTHDITALFGSVSTVRSIATDVTDSTTFNTATWASALKSAAGSATSVSVTFTVTTKNGSTTIGSNTVSTTVTINPSAPTVSAASVEIGNSVTVSTNRLSTTSARTHTIQYKIASGSYTNLATSVGASTTFNTASYVSALVSAGSGCTVTFNCITYVNSVNIGSKTTTTKVTINPSAPTLDKSSVTVGGTVTLTTNRLSTTSARTHTVAWKIGSTTLETDSSVTTSCNINTSSYTNTIMDAIGSTASSGTIVATVTTYVNSTSIGSKTVSFTANVDTSVYKPTITFGTRTDTSTSPAVSAYHSSSQMINALSKLNLPITFGVTNTHGMALASCTITYGTAGKATPSVSGTSGSYTLVVAGVNFSSVTVTLKDARGTTVTATNSWTLLGYAKPTITTKEVSRISMTGTNAQFSLSGTAYAGTYSGSSSLTNSLTITYTVKPVGGSSASGATTYTKSLSGSGSRSWTQSATFSESFVNDSQYDVEFTVTDAFGVSVSSGALRIYNGLPVWGWGEDHFDVYGDVHIHDRSDASERWVLPDAFNAILENDGRKNLLPTPQSGDTVNNGITYSVKGNGRVAATGTATANASFIISLTWTEPSGNYFFSGIETGSASTGYVFVWDNATSARAKKWDRSTDIELGVSSSKAYEVYLVNGQEYSFYYRIQEGATVSNLSWYPMVWDGRIASTDYVQYSPPGQSTSTTGTNIDSLVSPGAYTVTNPTGTLPITSSYTQIYVLDSAYSWVPQIGVFSSNVYYRYKSSKSSAWDPWKRLNRERGTLASGNLDDVEVNTVYYLTTSNTYTNAPSTAGILETIASTGTTSIKSQTLRNGALFYYRYGNSNGWGAWYRVTATAV